MGELRWGTWTGCVMAKPCCTQEYGKGKLLRKHDKLSGLSFKHDASAKIRMKNETLKTPRSLSGGSSTGEVINSYNQSGNRSTKTSIITSVKIYKHF